MNPDKLNLLSSGGIKGLNFNSNGYRKFHNSQNALLPQSKNNITKDRKKKVAGFNKEPLSSSNA